MMQSFYEVLDSLIVTIGLINVFIASLVLICSVGVVAIIVSAVKTGYSLSKRLWYFAFVIAVLAIELCVFSRVDKDLTALYISISVALIFSVPVLAIPSRKAKIRKEHRAFARFLDEQINCQVVNTPCDSIKTLKQQPYISQSDELNLNFSHVKNVIERLNYYGLSQTDKNTVENLSEAIKKAELGDCNKEIKSSINDGLGGLLKIMSKYGV